MEKRLLLRLSFKEGSPASSLKPRENQNDWGWNEYAWLALCCTDKSLSSSAGSTIRPHSRLPASLPFPGAAPSQWQLPAGWRGVVRRKEQSQNHRGRGFGFWKLPGTALVAGWEYTTVLIPLQRLSPLSPTIWREGGRHRGTCRTKWWTQLPTQWASAGWIVSPHLGMELRCLQEALSLPLQLQQSHCPRKLINQVLLFCT